MKLAFIFALLLVAVVADDCLTGTDCVNPTLLAERYGVTYCCAPNYTYLSTSGSTNNGVVTVTCECSNEW